VDALGVAVKLLSLIIPAYNEQDRLRSSIERIRRWVGDSGLETEIVVVDDGSTDGTREVIEAEARNDDSIRLIHRGLNRGKGATVREGLAQSRGDAVVFFDADLAYGLAPLQPAIERLEGGADMVIGARDLSEWDSRWRYSPARRAATSGFNMLVEWMLPLGIPDTQCGFKGFRGEVARHLCEVMTVDGFAFDIEILVIARLWSLRIDRIPVEMGQEQGSSINLARDSLRMGLDVARVRSSALAGRYPPRPGDL
jgi:dolichyl-phosphate beta-glucosyltransferase